MENERLESARPFMPAQDVDPEMLVERIRASLKPGNGFGLSALIETDPDDVIGREQRIQTAYKNLAERQSSLQKFH